MTATLHFKHISNPIHEQKLETNYNKTKPSILLFYCIRSIKQKSNTKCVQYLDKQKQNLLRRNKVFRTLANCKPNFKWQVHFFLARIHLVSNRNRMALQQTRNQIVQNMSKLEIKHFNAMNKQLTRLAFEDTFSKADEQSWRTQEQ